MLVPGSLAGFGSFAWLVVLDIVLYMFLFNCEFAMLGRGECIARELTVIRVLIVRYVGCYWVPGTRQSEQAVKKVK
jgi:hypothetical protein